VKKLFVCVLTAGFLLSLAGCGSSPAAQSGGGGMTDETLPWAKEYSNASEDVLVGVGLYRMGDDLSKMNTAKTFAESRARAEIARQLQIIVKNMLNDYTATSELDPSASLSFQEDVTQSLTKVSLSGVKSLNQGTYKGVYWVAMEYSKSNAAKDVDQVANAAKLKVPQVQAFNAIDRMNAAFDKEAGGGPDFTVSE
jgi:hypothetical protein